MDKLSKLAIQQAMLSPCKKRRVGAIITDIDDTVLGIGYNFNRSIIGGGSCEDKDGNTSSDVMHAEVVAIRDYQETLGESEHLTDQNFTKMHVTHQPCDHCLGAIQTAGINKIIVVEGFMKFDTDKLRYDLIPPSATKALAEVLTYGAKKYKPNNWKEVEDYDRYTAAFFRHFEAWRGGEQIDAESGKHHLDHCLTNIAFLVELAKD